MAGNGHWQADTSSVDQDGLLPVVKFLQSALAMKAKVIRLLSREQDAACLGIMTECFVYFLCGARGVFTSCLPYNLHLLRAHLLL